MVFFHLGTFVSLIPHGILQVHQRHDSFFYFYTTHSTPSLSNKGDRPDATLALAATSFSLTASTAEELT